MNKYIFIISMLVVYAFNSVYASGLPPSNLSYIESECVDHKVFCNFKYGKPFDKHNKVEQILCRDNYTLGYDYDNRIPLWVIYEIHNSKLLDSTSAIRKKHKKFISDQCIPQDFRVKTEDYTKSGYERGHLAPFNNVVHDSYTAKLSNILTNITPQKPSFNKGIWKILEKYEHNLIKKSKINNLYVITGPIYNEKNKSYLHDKGLILTPDSFFKILYDNEQKKALAFIIKNEKDTNLGNSMTRLEQHISSIDEIEHLTNFNFFTEIDTDTEAVMEARKSELWDYDVK